VGILILEATGPDAERLADEAGRAADIAVGFDPEFRTATFDSETLDGEQLQAAVFEALSGIDPAWQDHLQPAD
jgi:hypothetical protein